MAVYDQNLISQELQDIPYGNIRIVGKSSLNTDIFPQKINFQSKINGTGKATILPLFPGCFMTFFTFRANSLSGYHPAYESLIQIGNWSIPAIFILAAGICLFIVWITVYTLLFTFLQVTTKVSPCSQLLNIWNIPFPNIH